MVIKTHIEQGTLHHAYCIEGNKDDVLLGLESFLNGDGFKTVGNPDFSDLAFATFGIDESRALIAAASQKAFDGSLKIFVISADKITLEAQNSLLLIFEDPPPNTHFFLIVEMIGNLLPTLRSRVYTVKFFKTKREENQEFFRFVRAGTSERLKLANVILSDEETAKQRVRSLFEEAEKYLAAALEQGDTRNLKVSEEVAKMRSYTADRSPSFKMLVENLALILPREL